MFILIVDNNHFYVSVLKEMLLEAGFNAIGSHENGLGYMLQPSKYEIPDVLIIDQNQCYANGIDVIKTIRNSNPEVTVIILTNGASPLNSAIIPEIGSTLYFSKDSITADNLPQILYSIFTEKISFAKKRNVPKELSLFRKTFSRIMN
jgi:DNA-binding NarL/FixJ family response regulator